MHQGGHGDSLREGNELITSWLVVGDCPRQIRNLDFLFVSELAAYNRLTIGRYGSWATTNYVKTNDCRSDDFSTNLSILRI